MVRFNYKRRSELFNIKSLIYFPHYIETWTSYDPADTNNCTEGNGWQAVWAPDEDRDKLHRKNSFYYRREIQDDEDEIRRCASSIPTHATTWAPKCDED